MTYLQATKLKQFTGGLLAAAIASTLSVSVQAEEKFLLEEIIVTATKREASLQDIPMTVNVVTAATLREAGVVNIEGIAQLVPSLTVTRNLNPFAAALRIRGIGSSQNDPSLEASVAFIVDGIYMGRSGLGMSDFTDIQRVEVLNGPQGTLYGKNANAGVISIVTERPNMDETEGFLEVTAGDYSQRTITGAVSGPLADNVAYRLSGNTHQQDGYIENDIGDDQNEVDDWNLRGKLLWEPTDTLGIMLTASHVDRDTTCCAADATQTDAITNVLIAQGKGVPANDAFDYQNPVNVSSDFDMQADSATVAVDYEMDTAVFSSLTGWNKYDYTTSADADRSELDILAIIDDTYTGESISQEFRLTSELDGPWEYLVGLYYLNDEVTRGDGTGAIMLGEDFPAVAPNFALLGQPGDTIRGKNKWNTQTWAGFGQATYNFTEEFSVTGGVRYTQEGKDADLFTETYSTAPSASIPGAPTVVGLIADDIDEEFHRNDDGPTYLSSLQYFVAPDVMVFATVATGTKAGGFNGVSGTPEERPFDEEKTINYELGLKSKFLDQRVVLNAAVFYEEFDDLQFLAQKATGAGQIVSNAAKAETRGADLSFTVLPLANLVIDGGLQYLDASYTEGPLEKFDVVQAPEWSGNLSATLFFPLADGKLYLRSDYSYMADHYTNPTYQPASSEQDRELVNFRLGWRNDNWDIATWVKNATDDEYSTLTGTPIQFTGTAAEWLMPPRTYGVTARYSF